MMALFETLRYCPINGLHRLDRHLNRAARSCSALSIPFDQNEARHRLTQVVHDQPLRCRLDIAHNGMLSVTNALLPANSAHPWRIAIAIDRLDANNPMLQHKTTERALYNKYRDQLPCGLEEVLFLNQHEEVCEGTISNLFIKRSGLLLTPPLRCGLLPGVLREDLLESGAAAEQVISVAQLRNADQILLGNSLRGLIPAMLTEHTV